MKRLSAQDDNSTATTNLNVTSGILSGITSYNKVAITAPATAATLTIANNKTFTCNNNITLQGTDTTVFTFPTASDTIAGLAAVQTITGAWTFGSAGAVGKLKIAGTTSGSTILDATAVASGTLTLPAATDTLVGKATTDTLTNKTLTTPVIDQFGTASGLGAAWATYTPTITAAAGTFTTVSAAGTYKQIGKTVVFHVNITITTNGTASGNVKCPLPVTARAANIANIYGRARAVSGKGLQGDNDTTTNMLIFAYDNTYPGANGEVLSITGTYEAA